MLGTGVRNREGVLPIVRYSEGRKDRCYIHVYIKLKDKMKTIADNNM